MADPTYELPDDLTTGDPVVDSLNARYLADSSPEAQRRRRMEAGDETRSRGKKMARDTFNAATDFIPSVMGFGAASLVPKAMRLGWLARMGAAGGGEFAGEVGAQRLRGEPPDFGRAAARGITGATIGQGGAEVINRGSDWVSQRLMSAALPAQQAIVKEEIKRAARRGVDLSPDDIDLPGRMRKERFAVGRVGGGKSGSTVIGKRMDDVMDERAVLYGAGVKAGRRARLPDIEQHLQPVRDDIRKLGDKAQLQEFDKLMAGIRDEYRGPASRPGAIRPWKKIDDNEMQKLKKLWEDYADAARAASDKGSMRASAKAKLYQALARGAREWLETNPARTGAGRSVGDLNLRYQELMPLQEVAFRAELPRTQNTVLESTRNAMLRPSLLSRLSLAIDNPIARFGLTNAPRAATAAIAPPRVLLGEPEPW